MIFTTRKAVIFITYKKLYICCIVFCFVLSGCKDRKEIEERAFVIGAAFDLPEATDYSKSNHHNMILGTYQVMLPNSNTSQGSGSNLQKYSNISAQSNGIFVQIRQIAQSISRPLYFPHIKTIIISKKLAQKPHVLNQILDVFYRDNEMRRNVHLYISNGKAKKMLELKTDGPEDLPAEYIGLLSNHPDKNAQMLESVRIGQVQGLLLSNTSFALPLLKPANTGGKLEGAALFRGTDFKMIGTLSGVQTQGLNYLTGKKSTGIIHISHKDGAFTYDIGDVNRNIQISLRNPYKPKYDIDIDVNGVLADVYWKDIKNTWTLQKITDRIEKEIKKNTMDTLNTLQHEYTVDVINFGEHYERANYRKWIEIKKDWEQGESYFSKADVVVRIHVNIEHSGAVQKNSI
ncbi:TPA: Ger(x)C family spore germination protein [Bacillus luti]|nr:Ger(x)C family spore germination protein [Bacillus luti]